MSADSGSLGRSVPEAVGVILRPRQLDAPGAALTMQEVVPATRCVAGTDSVGLPMRLKRSVQFLDAAL